jgi:KDO2-lipid IV(A) lauroyltransferase
MSLQKNFRNFRRSIGSIASLPARPFFYIFLRLPGPFAHAAAEVLGRVFWLFGFPWKRQAMENLRLAYKDTRSDKQLKAIARLSMINIFRMVVELTVVCRPPFTIVKETQIEGEQHLIEARRQGKPVLLLGSHVGSFLMAIFTLSLRGYPVHYIFKQPQSGSVSDFIIELNRNMKLNPIPLKPRSEATKRSLRTLRDNEILWIALDQNAREGDVGVEFFGVKAATARGPAVLAQRTGAVVLPIYARRQGWRKHTVIIGEPIELEHTDEKDKDIYKNLKRFNAVIEQEVRENPNEWWWVHKRWKGAHRYEQETSRTPEAD